MKAITNFLKVVFVLSTIVAVTGENEWIQVNKSNKNFKESKIFLLRLDEKPTFLSLERRTVRINYIIYKILKSPIKSFLHIFAYKMFRLNTWLSTWKCFPLAQSAKETPYCKAMWINRFSFYALSPLNDFSSFFRSCIVMLKKKKLMERAHIKLWET